MYGKTQNIDFIGKNLFRPLAIMTATPRKFNLFEEDEDVKDGAIHLRIISTSDVYDFGNWARCYTAFRELTLAKGDGNYTVILIPGDFLAPSVISCVDQGASMVDCLNHLGFQYCSFGNHETDVNIHALGERIRESKFVWINSNLVNLPDCIPKLPDYVKLDFESSTQKRSVALLGLLTDEKYLYRTGAFGGAKILPVAESALRLHEQLKNVVDCVIPLTHQSMSHDRSLAMISKGRFPVIIGGHDHSPFTETVAGVPIIKAGMDAINVAVTDIVWPSPTTLKDAPDVSISLIPVKRFDGNLKIAQLVKSHQERVLGSLAAAHLVEIRPQVLLTSKNIRVAQRTVGTMLTSFLRDALAGDCCILPSGTVRCGLDYPESTNLSFTYKDLVSELPFDDDIVVVEYPGEIIEEAVLFSRGPMRKGMGGFLQVDSGMELDGEDRIGMINGEHFERRKKYRLVTNILALEGIDDNVPMIKYFLGSKSEGGFEGKGPREGDPRRCPLKIGIQTVVARRRIVEMWTNKMDMFRYQHSVEAPSCITKVEFGSHESFKDAPDWFVEQLFDLVDHDVDGKIGYFDVTLAFLFCWFAGPISGIEIDHTYRIDPSGKTTSDELLGHLETILPKLIAIKFHKEIVPAHSALVGRPHIMDWLDRIKTNTA